MLASEIEDSVRTLSFFQVLAAVETEPKRTPESHGTEINLAVILAPIPIRIEYVAGCAIWHLAPTSATWHTLGKLALCGAHYLYSYRFSEHSTVGFSSSTSSLFMAAGPAELLQDTLEFDLHLARIFAFATCQRAQHCKTANQGEGIPSQRGPRISRG